MALSAIEAYKTQRNMDKCGVHWFKFDEDSGNVLDSKGSAIGTVYGTTRIQGWNGEGKALSFDGVDDYVQFNSPVIPIGKKSIKFDYLKSSLPTTSEFIFSNSYGSTANSTYCYLNLDGTLSIKVTKNGTSIIAITSSINICDGKWHEVLFVWDGSTRPNAVELSIDKINVVTSTSSSTETTNYNTNLRLGSNIIDTGTLYSKGQLDNFEVYNDIIDLSPINKIMVKNNDTSYVYYDTNDSKIKTINHEPTVQDFLDFGMDDVSVLNRQVTELLPMQMEDKTNILFTNGEVGKVYQKTIDLQKYLDIRSVKVEIK